MKILQVIQFLTPSRGGSVAVPYSISEELSNRGHKVTIITTDYEFDEDYANSIREKGVEVIKFPCMCNLSLFLYSPLMKNWASKNIKNYDVIHMHNFRSYQNNIIHKYAKENGVPYILQAHGSVMEFFKKKRLKMLYDFLWGNNILIDASTVIAITKKELKQYYKMGVKRNNIKIIPNGINFADFEKLPKKGLFRKKFNLCNEEKIILFLGRINEIKGLELLVRAFSEIDENKFKCKLVIVGPDDGFLNKLIKISKEFNIEKNLIFTGPLYGNDKIIALVDSDIFILPSIYETFPISLIEAFACSKPVIISKNCDVSESVENNMGIVVNYDIISIKNAIENLLSDDKLSKNYGNAGRIYAKEFCNWKKIVDNFEMIYQSIL